MAPMLARWLLTLRMAASIEAMAAVAEAAVETAMPEMPRSDAVMVATVNAITCEPFAPTWRVMAEAAHGLHFAHEFADETGRALHIVHRDISPSNLFVTFQGQVKVLDFGIARAETRSTRTTAGVVKGKYMYMSPEQARSLPVDRRADVFSLGVSLYEALTNTRPFARDTDLAILNSVLTGEFVPPRKLRPDIPVEVEQIVLQAMSTSPQPMTA